MYMYVCIHTNAQYNLATCKPLYIITQKTALFSSIVHYIKIHFWHNRVVFSEQSALTGKEGDNRRTNCRLWLKCPGREVKESTKLDSLAMCMAHSFECIYMLRICIPAPRHETTFVHIIYSMMSEHFLLTWCDEILHYQRVSRLSM